MARGDPNQSVTLSILDRLIDLDPKSDAEAPPTRAQSVRILKQSLRRDLEWLLNTRRVTIAAADESQDLRTSLINYGLPDFSSYTVNSTRDINRLAWLIEGAVRAFEPRLEGARVLMEAASDEKGPRTLKFSIEGLLRMNPAPERVSFDTVLELSCGAYQIKGEGG